MVDVNLAHSLPEGAIANEENNGPFFWGGPSSPVGQGLPYNTLYTQTLTTGSGGFLIWKKIGAGDASIDWRLLGAKDLSFDPAGLKFDAITIQSALQEIRQKTTKPINILTSSLNGNYNVTVGNSNIHVVTGSADNYSVTLPNATLLFTGRIFQVVNNSTKTISVKNNSGTILANLISGDTGDFTLESNPNAAGTWLATVITSAATGITSYVVTTNTPFVTTSTADDLITGFTVTPVSGRYAVQISADATINANNALAQYVAYKAGTSVENTRRRTQGVSSNYSISLSTIGEISVNGAQAIDVRAAISTSSLTIASRSLILIRLGAAL